MDKRLFYTIEFPLVLLAGILIGLILAEDFATKSSTVVFLGTEEQSDE